MRPNHPPGPRPPAIARCLNGSACLGGSASLGPVDTLQSRSTHSKQMDELEKSHEETMIFYRLTPTLIQPAMSARSRLLTTSETYCCVVHPSLRNCLRVWP